jgi:hypothetical protein
MYNGYSRPNSAVSIEEKQLSIVHKKPRLTGHTQPEWMASIQVKTTTILSMMCEGVISLTTAGIFRTRQLEALVLSPDTLNFKRN